MIDSLEQLQLDVGPIYATTSAGLAATVEGQQFRVESAAAEIAYEVYQHAGGAAVLKAQVPAPGVLTEKADKTALAATERQLAAATAEISSRPGDVLSTDRAEEIIGCAVVHAVADADGNLAQAVGADGTTLLARLMLGAERVEGDVCQYPFAVADAAGNIGFAITRDGLTLMTGTGSSGAESALAALDARNKARGQAVKLMAPRVQLPAAKYNIVMSYGQSLGEGWETWPSLSKSPQSGALMVGDNVDNLTEAGAYGAMGVDQFNPLVAYTRVGTSNLTGAQEAALSPGDGAVGEPPVIGLVNGAKRWLNDRALMVNDGRNLVAMSSAVAGKTIAQLSKVNPQDGVDRYGAMIAGVALAQSLAGSETCVCPVLTWLQGEWDYVTYSGSTNATRSLYSAALGQLFDDATADIVAATGQPLPPLKVCYQTGAAYTRNTDSAGNPGLHVGMAQLDVCAARDDAVMVGPIYPYTDKGGHLDANGSRWFGHQMAKVVAKVWAGEGWEPLRPIEVTRSGPSLNIHYHVPVPPLRFASPYVVLTPEDYPAKGYRVTSADGATSYTISAVEIVADTIVRITCAETIPSDALVWYAAQGTNGNGNVCDSDPTLAIESYEYVPERGMYSGANIPALVGKPYPLNNWSVAFCLPVTYSEF